ncbi:MAG: TetR/AcrR family transcriptional regulator [Bacteroidota bacterium]
MVKRPDLPQMREQIEKEETEERIFQAALQVFAAKGKSGARMQEIADTAGINKSMLHYYFRSKEKLYEAVFDYVFKRFELLQSTLEHAKTYKDTLRAFINGFVDAHHQDQAVIRLMTNENLAGGTTMGKILARKDDYASPPSILIRETIKAIERGEIRPVDPHHMLLTVISSCVFFMIWTPTIQIKMPGASENWDAFVEARKKHIFEMIYYGLSTGDGVLDRQENNIKTPA